MKVGDTRFEFFSSVFELLSSNLYIFYVFTSALSLKLTEYILFFRWFKKFAESFIKVPLLGAVSYLTLAVTPFCVIFAVVWAIYRDAPYAWIGQDILVRIYLTLCLNLMCL